MHSPKYYNKTIEKSHRIRRVELLPLLIIPGFIIGCFWGIFFDGLYGKEDAEDFSHYKFFTEISKGFEVLDTVNAHPFKLELTSPTIESPEIFCEEILEGEELYKSYAREICENYESITGEKLHEALYPEIIISQMYFESRYIPTATNSSTNVVGLMQISTYWQKGRAEKLGVTDLMDPYSNILVGVDLMNDLLTNYCNGELGYSLMCYNMNWDSARKLHREGKLSGYATDVINMAEQLRLEETTNA